MTPKQRAVLLDLTAGATIRAAAKNAGVAFSTIYRWKRIVPGFNQALAEARAQAFGRALETLKLASELAAQALVHLLTIDDPGERRRAATAILDLAFKATEREDVEARLAELERLLGQPEPKVIVRDLEARKPA